MPDTKLPALPAVTSAADDDLIYMVDVSDTTDDPTGTSVGIEKSDLFAGITGGSGGNIGNASRVLIEEIELTVAGEFDFDNIPDGYDRLIIVGEIESDSSSSSADSVQCYINGDLTDTNYYKQNNFGADGAINVQEAATAQVANCATSTSVAAPSRLMVQIENYAGTDKKAVRGEFDIHRDAAYAQGGNISMFSAITAPITRLRFRTDNHPTDQLLGKLQLIGEKTAPAVTPGVTTTITAKVPLETITNATAGEFDFNNIPSGYARLIIEGKLQSDAAGANDQIYGFFNEDLTAGNYHRQNNYAYNGSASVSETNNPALGDMAAAGSPTPTTVCFTVEAPDSLDEKIFGSNFFGPLAQASSLIVGPVVVGSQVSAALARIRLRTDNHPTDQLTGELTLYGEKEIPIPVDTGGRTLIEEITNSTAGEFDFDNIPQNYNRLIIEGSARGDVTATTEVIFAIFNADTTTANYTRQRVAAVNGGINAAQVATPEIAITTGSSAPTDAYSLLNILIEDYAGDHIKQGRGEFSVLRSSNDMYVGSCYMTHDSMTAAITRIRLRTDNHPTNQLLGTLRLYGEM